MYTWDQTLSEGFMYEKKNNTRNRYLIKIMLLIPSAPNAERELRKFNADMSY